MTKSTITRERLEELASGQSGFNLRIATLEESQQLASMALAAMDSEPLIADCDTEVYEKGVSVCLVAIPKETAEVICQNITAATGCKVDWHYFGGRVHIKALRLDSQPAPVVPEDVLDALQKVARIRLELNDFDGDRRGIADCLWEAEEALLEVVKQRAAMLQAEPVCTCPSGDGSLRWPCPVHPGNSPVIPDGYVLVPRKLTEDMIAAAMNCEDVIFNSDDSFCVQFGNIYDAMLAAAPQEVGDA
ncbi:hypothetical protein ACU62P_14640 [Klebsiella aerogenes]